MFLKLICLYVSVVCVNGAPPTGVVPLEKQQPTVIAILAQSAELETNGTFKFSYETANGIKRDETSYDKVQPKSKSSASSNEAGEDKSDESNEIHVQQGSYSYTAPDGSVITVRYIADENGFRPIGDHLPKAPALSVAAFARSSKNKGSDNAAGGSESTAAIVAAPARNSPKPPSGALKKAGSIKIEPRIADLSLEQESTAKPEDTSKEPSSTPGKSSTSQEDSSTTTEIPSTTAEHSSTTQSESSTTTVIPSTTPEDSSTTSDDASTTQDESSTTTETSTTADVSSTTEIASTSDAGSTGLDSPTTSNVMSSEVTSTEAASTTEQSSTKSTSSEEASTPTASTTDASSDSTPNTTTDATTVSNSV